MMELVTKLAEKVALNIATIASSTTTNGAAIDLTGIEGIEFLVQSGTITDGTYALQIQSADDSAFTVNAAVVAQLANASSNPAEFVSGDSFSFVAADDNVIKAIGYQGPKKFVRLQVVSTGVTTGGTFGAVAVQKTNKQP